MESILEVLTPDNLIFIFKGFGLTLYISLIAIVLSTLIGTVLAVMRNGKNPVLRIISSIYIEFVRNVPNLLWIFTIFLVFKIFLSLNTTSWLVKPRSLYTGNIPLYIFSHPLVYYVSLCIIKSSNVLSIFYQY